MNEKWEKIEGLIDKAERDLKAAEVLLKNEEADFHSRNICFHCQQCVEKYLKAYLIHKDVHAPRTHDLLYLLELCSDFDDHFKTFELVGFSSFGVDIRYERPVPILDEARESLQSTYQIVGYVKVRLDAEGVK